MLPLGQTIGSAGRVFCDYLNQSESKPAIILMSHMSYFYTSFWRDGIPFTSYFGVILFSPWQPAIAPGTTEKPEKPGMPEEPEEDEPKEPEDVVNPDEALMV